MAIERLDKQLAPNNKRSPEGMGGYFQGQEAVVLLSTQGTQSGDDWSLQGNIKKVFHNDVKGYVLDSTSQRAIQQPTFILPKQAKKACTSSRTYKLRRPSCDVQYEMSDLSL